VFLLVKVNNVSVLSQQCLLFHHAPTLKVAQQTRGPQGNVFRNRGPRDWKLKGYEPLARKFRSSSKLSMQSYFRNSRE